MRFDDYIKGVRKGRQAHDLEMEAMRDPLLGDALDGFDATPGDHSAALERLSEQIRRSAVSGRAAARSRREVLRERRVRGWSLAAAAVFLVGIVGGGVWLLRDGALTNTTRGTIARHTGSSGGYIPQEEVAILPPVTVIKEDETHRDSTRRKSPDQIALADITRVPDHPAEATDIAQMQFDAMEIAAAGEDIALHTPVTAAAPNPAVPAPAPPAAASEKQVVEQRAIEQHALRGRVVDASTGEALAGALVSAEAGGEAAVTDVDGHFLLPRVSEGAKIVASLLGYEEADITTADGKEVLIAMNEDSALLDEVVVIGYGVQRRSAVSGSVSTAKEPRRKSRSAASEERSLPAADTTQTAEFRRYIHDHNIVRSAVLGRVVLSFEIGPNGRPRNIEVIEAPENFPEAARAARRLLREGPDWPLEPSRKLITINL